MSKSEDFEVGDLLRSEAKDDDEYLFFLVKKLEYKNEFSYFVIGTQKKAKRFYFLDSFIFNKGHFKKV